MKTHKNVNVYYYICKITENPFQSLKIFLKVWLGLMAYQPLLVIEYQILLLYISNIYDL